MNYLKIKVKKHHHALLLSYFTKIWLLPMLSRLFIPPVSIGKTTVQWCATVHLLPSLHLVMSHW